MDNYLSYRWPETPPEGWTPETPPRRKRRAAHNVLVCLLLVGVLAGLVVGGWFLAGTALRSLNRSAQGGPAAGEPPSQSQQQPKPPASDTAGLTLPRAEAGLGVTLELDGTLTTPLNAREIYDLVLPAVVSVTAQSSQGYGVGSGVVMREDGYILTNHHVIEGADTVTVMLLDDGRRYDAKLVGSDEELDVAVLKIEGTGLAAARFGDSDGLKVGDPAYAIGNPMGYLYGTMTDGIISYLDRSQTVEGTEMTLIQTSAVLNSGSSGGALINEYGQVVGITVAKVSGAATDTEPQVEGLGFAIPISAARPFINHILETGESWRPAMGIVCYASEVDGAAGILVQSLQEGGPAQAAGILENDLILSANGRGVETVYALKRVLGDAGVGGTVEFVILREGAELTVSLTLVDSADLEAGDG